jgi:AmiR/NasT family two-component response regulator
VYAYGRDVFDQHAVDLGELFAKPAAVAVHNAQTLADALARTAKLRSALSIRTVIDQAIGVILVTTGGSAEDALTQLQAMSQAEHRTLADVAQHVIDDAVRRARDRPQSS